MSVRASGLGSAAEAAARNGLPGFYSYPYGGSRKRLRPAVTGQQPAAASRAPQPGVGARALAALRSLGGEASTTEIRRALDFDGGAPFNPAYLSQALHRLAAQEPPAVIPAGRDDCGKGQPGRWALGPGAGES